MYSYILNLEAKNTFEHPKQAQLLAEELLDLTARIEDTTEFDEEDVFISNAFESGAEVREEGLDQAAKWVAHLSEEFPDLVFSVDVTEPEELGSVGILERWYFRDGRRQVAEPYMVVPDFDPDEPGELIR